MQWSKLKEFCNSLDEKQLEMDVVVWREDEAISEINAEALKEDHYTDPENPMEGCFPLSDLIDEEDISLLKKVYDKGHPILWEKF